MRTLGLLLVGLAVLGMATGVVATEGGGNAYPGGAEGFMSGAIPPPGNYIINYMLYYSANDLMDGSGREIPNDFDLQVLGEVFRFVHVTDKQILGGSLAQHVFILALDVDVSFKHPFLGSVKDNKTAFGDIIVDPFILGWHKGPFHWATGVDIFLPVGSYDENDVANTGRNYWTFEPVFAISYLSKSGIEISSKFMYDINTENQDTNYESGDEFHFDYTIGKRFGNLALGIGGSYYKQVTGDDGYTLSPTGEMVDAGDYKGQQFSWGPQVAYQKGPMFFALKYQMETETENKPEGDKVWFKFVTAL